MKTPLLIVAFLCLRLAVVAQIPPPQFEWARSMGGWQDDDLADLAVAEDGSVYVTGSFKDFICFDTLCFPAASPDTSDIFLAKYDSVGVLQWAKAWGGRGIDEGKALALDKDQNLYITGIFADTFAVDHHLLQSRDAGRSRQFYTDIFILKLNPQGEILAISLVGGRSLDRVETLHLDSSGDIHIAGWFYSDSLFLVNSFSLMGKNDSYKLFWVKYDSDLKIVRAKKMEVSQNFSPHIHNISSDNYGIYLYGFFGDSLVIENNVLTSSKSSHNFLMRWNKEGTYQWSELFTKAQIYDMAVDEAENVYLFGEMGDSAIFDTLTFMEGRAIYLAKYSSEGRVQWVKKPVNGLLNNQSICYNRGQLYLTGSFSHTITIGDSTFTSPRVEQLLIARYDTTGNLVWVRRVASTSYFSPLRVRGNTKGDVTLAGGYNYNGLFFDSTLVINVFPAYMDVFVAQLHRDSLPLLPKPPAEWAVYPNPFEDHLFLWGDFLQGVLELSLYDLSGREIWKTQMLMEDTIFPLHVPIPVLSAGFYLLQIGQGRRSVVKKMIKR
ncbi:MAG: T9SS type A sorting domain-containing protein [Bacteroidia bacterium]